ncbi:MAG TPA: ATP-binding protein [Anaerolineae bacterium]|nr:ATP-binding protein [Anaerolineae bacterium]
MPAQGSDGFVLYLVGAVVSLTMLGMAVTEWHRLAIGEYKRISLAAGVILVTCLAAAAVTWARGGAPMPCLSSAVTGLAIAFFTWALLHRAFASARVGLILLAATITGVGLLLGACLLLPAARPVVTDVVWPAALLILHAAGLLLWLSTRRHTSPWLAVGYLLSASGVAATLVGQAQLLLYTLCVALSLFAVEIYRLVRADLTSYSQELQSVSISALQQTQDLAFLLEVAKAVASSLDLPVVLERVSEAVARAVEADWAYILLHSEDDSESLVVAARYGWWGRRGHQDTRPLRPTVVLLADFSLLRHAILRRRQVLANRPEDYQQFEPLHEALQRPQSGPTLVQPICAGDRSLGVILLGHVGRQRVFEDEDAQLCHALTGQVATAIDNARLYQSVDEQARRLADLLRVREEEAMQRQAILESIAEGVVVASETEDVVMANAAAERILGLSREKLIGRTIKRLYAELWRAGARQQGDGAVFQWGNKEVTGSLAPVKMPDGTLLGYVAVFRDVTRERQAELAKGQFIETVSHELRTPMTSIKGYVQLLAAGAVGPVSPQQRHFLNIVGTNTERMVSLVNNLIAISEMDRGAVTVQPICVDLANVIREAVNAIRQDAEGRDLDLVLTLPPTLAPAWGDAQQLRQVMDHLLDNAIRYTPHGGRITVWVAEAQLDDRGVSRVDLVVSVRDTGVGIPKEDHDRIFQKFYRGDNELSIEAGGTGVGLAIVRSLVQAHGGKVWVESEPGVGSTFSFTVPADQKGTRNH